MNLYDLLRRDEGLRLKPYQDTVGKTTIGIGQRLLLRIEFGAPRIQLVNQLRVGVLQCRQLIGQRFESLLLIDQILALRLESGCLDLDGLERV